MEAMELSQAEQTRLTDKQKVAVQRATKAAKKTPVKVQQIMSPPAEKPKEEQLDLFPKDKELRDFKASLPVLRETIKTKLDAITEYAAFFSLSAKYLRAISEGFENAVNLTFDDNIELTLDKSRELTKVIGSVQDAVNELSDAEWQIEKLEREQKQHAESIRKKRNAKKGKVAAPKKQGGATNGSPHPNGNGALHAKRGTTKKPKVKEPNGNGKTKIPKKRAPRVAPETIN